MINFINFTQLFLQNNKLIYFSFSFLSLPLLRLFGSINTLIKWRIYLLKNNKNNEFQIKLINCGIEIKNEKDLKLKIIVGKKIFLKKQKESF